MCLPVTDFVVELRVWSVTGYMGIRCAVDDLGPHKIDVYLPGDLSLRS